MIHKFRISSYIYIYIYIYTGGYIYMLMSLYSIYNYIRLASLHDSLNEWSSWTLNEAVFCIAGALPLYALWTFFAHPPSLQTLNWVCLHLCIRLGLWWPAWVPHPSSDRARSGVEGTWVKEIVWAVPGSASMRPSGPFDPRTRGSPKTQNT